MRFLGFSLITLILATYLACSNKAARVDEEILVSEVVNGLNAKDAPTTVAITMEDGALLQCSGTLIGCETVITAAHCVDGIDEFSHWKIFANNGGVFKISKVIKNQNYNSGDLTGDVAIIKLETAVDGISPAKINDMQNVPWDSEGIIVGFGTAGGEDQTYGLKRTGKIKTSSCHGEDEDKLCWNFDKNLGAPGEDSNTCGGDSGGPLFVNMNGTQVLAGVTSGGTNWKCVGDDFSFVSNIFGQREFIKSAGGADLQNQKCGTLPQVGTSKVFSKVITRTYENSPKYFSINVPPNTKTLRVALNGKDAMGSGSDLKFFNLNLAVRFGSRPTGTIADCFSKNKGIFEFCEIQRPAAGKWVVQVKASEELSAIPFQLTTTVFSRKLQSP